MSGAAQWLERLCGIGGVFAKEQLRAAFPGVTQIDRRVRDLREREWVIDTRRQDPTLGQTEMGLVASGSWERPTGVVTPRERREVFVAWAYSCSLWGAQGWSCFEDAKHVRVQLAVRQLPEKADGLVPVCIRCSPTIAELSVVEVIVDGPVAAAARLAGQEWRWASLLRLQAHLLESEG